MIGNTICLWCKHHNKTGDRRSCTAFHERIPDTVYFGEHDHRFPYPGDNGILYEPEDEEAEALIPRIKEVT